MTVYKVGTRRSPMARVQCSMVIEKLKLLFPNCLFEEVVVLSSGDKKQGTDAARHGDKKDWIDGFEDLLLKGEIDFAVHSAKDVPVYVEEGLEVMSVLDRNLFQDAFIPKKNLNQTVAFKDLPVGSKIGMASLRRSAQLNRIRPDLKVVEVRGNVNTRLNILNDPQNDLAGLILSAAGLQRLQIEDSYEVLDPQFFIPAVNQGTLLVEFRKNDIEVISLLKTIKNEKVEIVTQCEREIIRELGADCRSAVGVYVQFTNETELHLAVKIFDQTKSATGENNCQDLFIEETCSVENYCEVAKKVAKQLISAGALKILG